LFVFGEKGERRREKGEGRKEKGEYINPLFFKVP